MVAPFLLANLGGCPQQTDKGGEPIAPGGGPMGIFTGNSDPPATSDGVVEGADVGGAQLVAPNLQFAVRKGNRLEVQLPADTFEGNDILYRVVSPPRDGQLSDVTPLADGSAIIVYAPPLDFTGIAQFSYVAEAGGQSSNIATVQIAVHPDVRFSVESVYQSLDLAVRLRAFTSTGEALPDGTYHWLVDDAEYVGPMASQIDKTVTIHPAATHTVRLILTYAGMTVPIAGVYSAGDAQAAQVVVRPMVSGQVRDDLGRPSPDQRVRAIGRSDYSARTDADGRYQMLLSPGWSGNLFVDDPGTPYAPDRVSLTEVGRNIFSQDFGARTLGGDPIPPPTPQPVAVTCDEDQTARVQLAAVPADGTEAQFEITSLPSHGRLRDAASGQEILPAHLPHTMPFGASALDYIPTSDFGGQDQFAYRTRIGTDTSVSAGVQITVRPQNDSPRFAQDTYRFAMRVGEALAFNAAVIDVDSVGNELAWGLEANPQRGGVSFLPAHSESGQTVLVTYRPDATFGGEDQFVIRCVDAAGAVANASVSVLVTNDPLVANAGADIQGYGFQSVTLSAAASVAPLGSTYEWRQVSGPTVTLNGAGTVTPTFRAPATTTNASLEFELTIRNSGQSASDRVRVTVNFSRQALLYSIHAALERLWQTRVVFNVSGTPMSGFASFATIDAGQPFWGDESGSACNLPLWDFQNRDGLPGVVSAFLTAYGTTQNQEYLRRARALGDALLSVQDALNGGWFQDTAWINDRWYNVGVWGAWNDRRHTPDVYQNLMTLDDSTSQSCALALLRIYEATGDVRYLNGARRFADQLVGLKDITYDGIQPYHAGGVPQVLPIERAHVVTYNQNADPRCPDGPYMPHKTLNDNTTSDAVILLMEMHRVSGDARYLDAVRLNIDYLLDRHSDHGYRGWAQQYHWRDDRIAWGRGKEPPAFVTCEHRVVEMLLAWRLRETDLSRKLRIETSIQRYLDWLRNDVPRPAGHADQVWRYYNHDPDAAALNTVAFARDWQRFFGEENEGNAEGGQPYRMPWDTIWITRLVDNTGRVDFARAGNYVLSTPDAPIGVIPTAWEPAYTSQSIDGAWPTTVNIAGLQRARISGTDTVGRVAGLAIRFNQLRDPVTDSDADGVSDSAEVAAGTNPRDSASHP